MGGSSLVGLAVMSFRMILELLINEESSLLI